jgi:hypothetical protein
MGKDGWRWIELLFAGAETALHFLRRGDELLPPSPFSSLWTTMSKPPWRDSNREASKFCQNPKRRLATRTQSCGVSGQ